MPRAMRIFPNYVPCYSINSMCADILFRRRVCAFSSGEKNKSKGVLEFIASKIPKYTMCGECDCTGDAPQSSGARAELIVAEADSSPIKRRGSRGYRGAPHQSGSATASSAPLRRVKRCSFDSVFRFVNVARLRHIATASGFISSRSRIATEVYGRCIVPW